MNRDYDNWNEVKKLLTTRKAVPNINEREVWWCSIGLNVGDEENGKGEQRTRPVLVVKKFNSRIFWAVPLSTQLKDIDYYHKITFNELEQSALLSHLRLFDTKRLKSRMGLLDEEYFAAIKEKLREFLV